MYFRKPFEIKNDSFSVKDDTKKHNFKNTFLKNKKSVYLSANLKLFSRDDLVAIRDIIHKYVMHSIRKGQFMPRIDYIQFFIYDNLISINRVNR